MQAVIGASEIQIDQLVERILRFRQLSRTDQRLLMSSLMTKDDLTEKDQLQIKRIFEAVQRGSIRVVD